MSEPPRSQRWLAQDNAHLIRVAAQTVLETVAASVAVRGQAVIALSGGSTPQKLFQTLADDYHKSRVPWDKLHVFWVDERCVPPQHPDSNFGVAQKELFSKVPIPVANIHRMHGETVPAAAGAKAYESELKSFFHIDKSLPVFDFILLGLGEDGHTASLFPRNEVLKEEDHWVSAPFVDKLNASRLTLTFPVINHARRVLFLVSGTSKASIIHDLFSGEHPGRLPAQMVQPAGDLIWLLDHEAASKLPNDIRFQFQHLENKFA